MPKVTNKTDAPKRNAKNNKSLTNEDQTVLTIVDKTDQSKSNKGIKRKASPSVEKVNKFVNEIYFNMIDFILENNEGSNNQ